MDTDTRMWDRCKRISARLAKAIEDKDPAKWDADWIEAYMLELDELTVTMHGMFAPVRPVGSGAKARQVASAELARPVPGGCEWAPDAGLPTYSDQPHHRTTQATVIVGANGNFRLCASCAALPTFRRYRVRVQIGR